MAEQSIGESFSCPTCAKRFRWKTELAGRSVTCGCGAKFRVPGETLAAADPYSLNDGSNEPPPVARAPAKSARTLPASLPPSPLRVPKMAAQQKAIERYDDADEDTAFKGFYLPMLMIVVGLAARIGRAVFVASGHSVGAGVGMVICEMILSVATMMLGCALAAQFLSVNFGRIDRAALKLAGIAVCSAAIGTWIASGGNRGGLAIDATIVAWHLVFVLYWLFFYMLFDLDLQETMMSVVIVAVIQLAASMGIAKLLGGDTPLSLFFSR